MVHFTSMEDLMKNITVFLGSRIPSKDIYLDAIGTLAQKIAEHNHTLVYGGAKVGTMGLLADAVLKTGNRVIGIMPEVLAGKEILHPNLTEAIIVKDMHERKAKLQEIGDVFVTMPGGCGTMEEIFEVITWNQIGVHNKPYCFINVDNFYQGINDYLKNALSLGFISQQEFDNIHFFDSVEALFESSLV